MHSSGRRMLKYKLEQRFIAGANLVRRSVIHLQQLFWNWIYIFFRTTARNTGETFIICIRLYVTAFFISKRKLKIICFSRLSFSARDYLSRIWIVLFPVVMDLTLVLSKNLYGHIRLHEDPPDIERNESFWHTYGLIEKEEIFLRARRSFIKEALQADLWALWDNPVNRSAASHLSLPNHVSFPACITTATNTK